MWKMKDWGAQLVVLKWTTFHLTSVFRLFFEPLYDTLVAARWNRFRPPSVCNCHGYILCTIVLNHIVIFLANCNQSTLASDNKNLQIAKLSLSKIIWPCSVSFCVTSCVTAPSPRVTASLCWQVFTADTCVTAQCWLKVVVAAVGIATATAERQLVIAFDTFQPDSAANNISINSCSTISVIAWHHQHHHLAPSASLYDLSSLGTKHHHLAQM